ALPRIGTVKLGKNPHAGSSHSRANDEIPAEVAVDRNQPGRAAFDGSFGGYEGRVHVSLPFKNRKISARGPEPSQTLATAAAAKSAQYPQNAAPRDKRV